ncbi:hypothetical protein WKW79_13625 [Variovorax robiniae]|uniref:FTR1 family iron permease n=1 Tax=Variovorax robiniae TaxID=1836199 RepID=A0ABU8X929_9BURK
MFQAFVIVGREGCELLLVILALQAWARREARPELIRWVLWGVVAGFAAAASAIVALPPSGMDEWFDIALTFVFGLSLALVSSGTMASVAGVGKHATHFVSHWLAHRASGVAVLAITAFSTLREVLEAVLLLRFVAARQTTEELAWGVALGLLACALLAVAWRALRERRGAHWAFRLSAVVLFVLGMQMLIDSVAEVLLRGVGGERPARWAYALTPYLENGDRYWVLCVVLATIPLMLWTRDWWRRTGD